MSSSQSPTWSEDESARFIALGRVYTPRRDEMLDAFLDLIPAGEDDVFTGVDAWWVRAGHALFGGFKPGGGPSLSATPRRS